MGNELTSSANIVFAITALFGIAVFHYLLHTRALTDNTRTVVRAWIAKDIAVGVRIGWWIFALILAPHELRGYSLDGSPLYHTYHPFFVEYKHWMTIPSSLLYVHGQVKFIDHITNINRTQRYGLIAAAVFLAALPIFAGF